MYNSLITCSLDFHYSALVISTSSKDKAGTLNRFTPYPSEELHFGVGKSLQLRVVSRSDGYARKERTIVNTWRCNTARHDMVSTANKS